MKISTIFLFLCGGVIVFSFIAMLFMGVEMIQDIYHYNKVIEKLRATPSDRLKMSSDGRGVTIYPGESVAIDVPLAIVPSDKEE